jgi:hypothetical protein
MKPGIMDLSKWVEKTAQAVRRICSKKQAPCVGLERWNYVIELAFDPNNPPTQEERNQLQNAFEFISEGVRRIMDDKTGCNEVEDYTREVPWH